MTNIKNKQKVVVVINNNLRRKGGKKRTKNPLSKTQETIIRHHYFNQPIFNPIVPNNAPAGTRVSDLEKDKEIASLKHETERNHKQIQNLANKLRERDDEVSFRTPEKSTLKQERNPKLLSPFVLAENERK